jgi:outer membrane protein
MLGAGMRADVTNKFTAKSLMRVLMATAALAMIAQPAAADTLADAMSMAYTGNPNLLAARAQLRATDESVPIALSGWRPTLQVNGNVTRQRVETTSPGPAGSIGSFQSNTAKTASVTLNQPLFRGFKTVFGTSAAENTVYSQRARLAGTEAQVMLQVAIAYLDVLQNQAVVELNMNNTQVLSRQLEATNDRFRVGEITRTDVAQSEASLAGARAGQVQAEGLLQQARSAYENVVGKAPENLVQPAIPQNLPANLEGAVTAAIASNPNYIAADYAARSATDNITVVQGDLLPSASLVAQWTKGYDTSVTGYRSDQAIAQAQVTVPLYQQGAEWARLRQAKDTASQARLLADQARLDARNASTVAYEAFQSATASIESYKSQIAASEISVEGLQRQQEVGSATILDVLIQEQNLLSARVNLVRTLHDQAVAAYQVLSSTGRLNAADLGLNAPVYDPTAHYNSVKFQAIGTDSQPQSAVNPAAKP